MKRVLVAIDASEASVRAGEFARSFFADMPVEILAINVSQSAVPWVSATWGYGLVAPYAIPPLYDTELAEKLEDDARRLGEQQIRDAGLAGADETMVEFGDPATQISRAAVEHDVDLIVVGTNDRGMLRRLLQGSTTEDLVRHAPRPVLVVRHDGSLGPEDAEEAAEAEVERAEPAGAAEPLATGDPVAGSGALPVR